MPYRNKGGAVLTILAVVALIILLFVVTAYFYPEAFAPIILSKMRQDHPSLILKPKPMHSVPAANVMPERLTSYGYEFQTPWGAPQSVQNHEIFKAFTFPDNVQMYAYDPAKAFDFLRTVIGASANSDSALHLFGWGDFSSRYEAMRALLEVVPPVKVSLFGDRQKTIATFTALIFKSKAVHDTAAEILAIDIGERRGFQVNEPNNNAKSTVFLFDKEDSAFEFSFSRVGNNQNKPIPQAEINAVLLSIRPASPAIKPPKKKE